MSHLTQCHSLLEMHQVLGGFPDPNPFQAPITNNIHALSPHNETAFPSPPVVVQVPQMVTRSRTAATDLWDNDSLGSSPDPGAWGDEDSDCLGETDTVVGDLSPQLDPNIPPGMFPTPSTGSWSLGVDYSIPIEEQEKEHGIFKHDKSMARLYKLCDDTGAPQYLLDKVLAALREEESINDFDIHSGAVTQRKPFFQRVHKALKIQQPEEVLVTLADQSVVSVYRFDIQEQLQRHLLSRAFSDIEKMDFYSLDDLWGTEWPKPNSPRPQHTSLIDSTWYHRTAESRSDLLETGHYCLHPLVLYIDKTGTDSMQKATLEPLVCTSANLNQQSRQDTKNWFVLGYIPNLELSSSALRTGAQQGQSTRDYHSCIRILLEPLKRLQQEMPVMIHRRGEFNVREYKTIFPISTIIGDNLSQDRLCAKLNNKGPTSVRMTRACLTSFCDCNIIPHKCTRVPAYLVERLSMASIGSCCNLALVGGEPKRGIFDGQPSLPPSPNYPATVTFLQQYEGVRPRGGSLLNLGDIKALAALRLTVAGDILKKCLGSHRVVNAFQGMDLGHNSCIHTATVADIMHSVEEGIIKYVVQLLIEPMTPSEKGQLDAAVTAMFALNGRNRSGERDQYPRVCFRRGFSSLKVVTADEHVGQLFVISILLQTKKHDDKDNLFRSRFALDFDSLRAARVEQKKKADLERKAAKAAKKRVAERNRQARLTPAERQQETQASTNRRPQRVPRAVVLNLPRESPRTVVINPDDEEELSHHSREHPDQRETDQPDPNLARQYTQQEWQRIMEHLDLTFMHTSLDLLPFQHQQVYASILAKRLKPSARLTKLLSCRVPLFPSGILDFQQPTHTPGPPEWEQVCHPFVSPVVDSDNTPCPIQILPERSHCTSIKMDYNQFRDWTEQLLAFHAFLKYGADMFKEEANIEAYKGALNGLLGSMILTFFRGSGTHDFRLPKVLECFHFGKDFVIHGPPVAHSTDTGERGLKRWAKAPAVTAQNRDDSEFKRQVCKNLVEQETLRRLVAAGNQPKPTASLLPHQATQTTQDEDPWFNPKGRSLEFVSNTTGGSIVGKKRSNANAASMFPEPVLSWFKNTFAGEYVKVQLITEITLAMGSDQQELLRAHPDYRSGGPWYDCVDIKYADTGNRPAAVYPARCACFFEWPLGVSPSKIGMQHLECSPGQLLVLVQESEWQSEEQMKKERLLYSHYTLNGEQKRSPSGGRRMVAKFKCVLPTTLTGRAYCIDPIPENGGVFWKEPPPNKTTPIRFEIIKVKDRKSLWPRQFLSSA